MASRRRLGGAALLLLAAAWSAWTASPGIAPRPRAAGFFVPLPPRTPAAEGQALSEAPAFLSRRSAAAGGLALGFAGLPALGNPAAAAEVDGTSPLSASQLLSIGQYIPDLRVARRALDGVRLLAERGDDEGDEEIRVALRKPPINGIRKAASKVLRELPEAGGYRDRRSAQYETIKAYLVSVDDGARPGADRAAAKLPEKIAGLQESLDAFTAGYGIEQ